MPEILDYKLSLVDKFLYSTIDGNSSFSYLKACYLAILSATTFVVIYKETN